MAGVQLADGFRMEGYLPNRDADVLSLGVMFSHYLLEELDRTGDMALGNPVGGYLVTVIFRHNGRDAGFLSLDPGRSAVEVIFVEDEFRGRGLATLALTELARHAPRTLALKTPLSPGGEALVTRLGLARADNSPEEEADIQRGLDDFHRNLKKVCPHKKKAGDPRKPCKRCAATALRRYASAAVSQHAREARALMR